MATLNGNISRKPYTLSVTPVDYSLTAGTDIPPPAESPRSYTPEPPTPGGGPLTSHPATPPATETESTGYNEKPTSEPNRGRTDSFRTDTSPASAAHLSSSPQTQRRPSRVRKLLSLTNLRGSFSSSRTSLSLPRGSNETPHTNGVKRPSSPSTTSIPASSIAPRPQLREKKSGNWFKRKSSLFLLSDGLDPVDESYPPDTRESKRLKESSPAPLLPEIGSLSGGRMSGGDFGWDGQVFKR